MSFFKANTIRAAALALMLLGAVALGPGAAFAGGQDDYGGERGESGYKGGRGHDENGQSVKGGDQHADQSNGAHVGQNQRNKNWFLGPALAFGQRSDACGCDYSNWDGKSHGDDGASTRNAQGNRNHAGATVGQDNAGDQSQAARQDTTSSGGAEGDSWHGGGSGDQSVKGGDQDASQTNEAKIKQDQSNKNFNLSPALSLGGGKDGCGCESKDGYFGHGGDDGASTKNVQGNVNHADANVDQGNSADQHQAANQSSEDSGDGESWWHGGDDQSIKGGDQDITQDNTARVKQTQENKNVNISPAISIFGGDASTKNFQANHNSADAEVTQGNDAEQTQAARQTSTSDGSGGDQSVKGGDQDATQANDAKVGQEQTNKNVNISPAISVFGGDASTSNYQANSNDADANVTQDNSAGQGQAANQSSLVGSLLGN